MEKSAKLFSVNSSIHSIDFSPSSVAKPLQGRQALLFPPNGIFIFLTSPTFFLDFVHWHNRFSIDHSPPQAQMKIAISATGNTTDSMVDQRFGRAAWLLIVDSGSGKLLEAIDNTQGREAAQGAGISAAALVADKGVEAVLTGRVGPKAMPVLEKAGIRAVNDVNGSVKDAIAQFSENTEKPPTQQSSTTVKPAPAGAGERCGCGKGPGKGQGRGQGQGGRGQGGQGRGQGRR